VKRATAARRQQQGICLDVFAALVLGAGQPPMAESAVDAAAVAKKRRRDTDMRIGMEILAWKKQPKKRPFLRNVDNYAIPS
jgi:hypothetical protein